MNIIRSISYIGVVAILYILVLTGIFPAWAMYIPLLLAFIPIVRESYEQLTTFNFGTEFFLFIATIVSLLGHQTRAITTVLLIMLIAEFFEQLIQEKTDTALQSLMELLPNMATIKEDDGEREVPLDAVQPGMRVVVTTGGRIPVDGVISRGSAGVNEAALTGESTIKEKAVNDPVYAGTFIESGSIIIITQKVGQSTFFGKIKELISHSEESKAQIATLAHVVSRILVPALLIFILLVFIITQNMQLVVTLLVFGSPLELTIIPPLTILSGIAAAFRHGILIKGGRSLERLAYVDTMIFDKTGTLTRAEPAVVSITSFDKNLTERDILHIAAIAEKNSGFVLARAVVKRARLEGLDIPDPETFTTLTGHGVEMTWQGKKYVLGNRHFIQAPEHGNITCATTSCFEGDALHSVFYIADAHQVIGKIVFADPLRSNASRVVHDVKSYGITTYLLSGDRADITSHVARELSIDHAYGDMFPDQKIAKVKELQSEKHIVAMTGDGINDAPALKQADVGIALGAMGMEPAIEAADIVLMTNDISKISFVVNLSRQALRIIKQNIFIGFLLIHMIGMTAAFFGAITPIQAALFHAVPDLLILLNSVRLIRFKG